jgi:hypothetical protein
MVKLTTRRFTVVATGSRRRQSKGARKEEETLH